VDLKCACGHEFEVPDGTKSAKCPACGKAVEVAESQNWLDNVEVDGLSLEEAPEEEAPQPEATATAPAPTPGVEAPAAEGQAPPRGRSMAHSAAAASRRQSAPAKKAPKHGPPAGVLDLFKVLRDEPAEAAPLLRDGITSRRFMTEMGVGFAILSVLGAVTLAWLCCLGPSAIGTGVMFWLKLVCETAAVGIMLSLLAIGLKFNCKPLGVVQGVVFARMTALLLLLPLGIVLGIISAVMAAKGLETFPSGLLWVNRAMLKLYVLTVMFVQGGITMGVFKLGCGGSLAISAVAVYGASILARTIFGEAGF